MHNPTSFNQSNLDFPSSSSQNCSECTLNEKITSQTSLMNSHTKMKTSIQWEKKLETNFQLKSWHQSESSVQLQYNYYATQDLTTKKLISLPQFIDKHKMKYCSFISCAFRNDSDINDSWNSSSTANTEFLPGILKIHISLDTLHLSVCNLGKKKNHIFLQLKTQNCIIKTEDI